MNILREIVTSLKFRVAPTTALIVLIYATIFASVLLTDRLPNVPHNQLGLDIQQAYADLHQIAVRPHPYNSHTNDHVRSYILSRLQNIAARYDRHRDSSSHIRIWDDLKSNASWALPSTSLGIYFEGTNIFAKVQGTDPAFIDGGGVLFSSHYDSVSTAPGVTDDGLGVVTMLQLVEYFAENRPKRTAVFFFNNGEEDGLNGAHLFLGHPWAKLVDTFFNLEGAAAGGRPILFRASSSAPLRSFLSVPHPHTNVIAANAFALGLIRSATDYSVFNGPQSDLRGLDFAFYRGRSRYHTKWDSIPGTTGGTRALWAMMEATRTAGWALLNENETHEDGGDAVYFDLFGSALVMFSFTSFLAVNILLLIIGPVAIVVLILSQHLVGTNVVGDTSSTVPLWRRVIDSNSRTPFWARAKFWLALFIILILEILLVLGYTQFAPFIVYSYPYTVFISTLSLAYLCLVIPLKFPIVPHQLLLPEQEKHTTLLQTYIFSWIALVFMTVVASRWKIGGLYFVTFWNLTVFLALVLAYVEVLLGAHGARANTGGAYETDADAQRHVSGVRFEADEAAPVDEDGHRPGVQVETEPTEITPLISQRRAEQDTDRNDKDKEVEGAVGWWIVQALVAVPLPVILLVHLGLILFGSLPQTLADGNSPVVVYAATALLSIFVVLPLAPYSVKLYRGLTFVVCIIFILTTLFAWTTFPFSQETQLKVFFKQSVELEGDNAVKAVTSVFGVQRYLQSRIINTLPSTWSKDVQCGPRIVSIVGHKTKRGVWGCSWDSSTLLPSAGRTQYLETELARPANWFKEKTARLNATMARISIQGTNTRNCRLYFDEPILGFEVVGSGGAPLQPGYDAIGEGLREVYLWSRTWDHEFVVDVVGQEGKTINGSVACEWTEYESGVAGGKSTGGKIPAYEEVLAFLPRWAVVTKLDDGLVEAWTKFSV